MWGGSTMVYYESNNTWHLTRGGSGEWKVFINDPPPDLVLTHSDLHLFDIIVSMS